MDMPATTDEIKQTLVFSDIIGRTYLCPVGHRHVVIEAEHESQAQHLVHQAGTTKTPYWQMSCQRCGLMIRVYQFATTHEKKEGP